MKFLLTFKYYKRVPFAEIRDYVYNKYDPIVWNYVSMALIDLID